jgi:hypothetical protein
VHTIRLRLQGDRLGALGLFGAAPGTLNDPDLTLPRDGARRVPRDRAGQQTPGPGGRADRVAGRAAVEMAKGVLAETHAVHPQEAFHRLRD